MIFALFRKAILAGKVAIMGNVEAKCLHHVGSLLKVENITFIYVLGKELSVLFQFQDLIHCFPDLLFGIGNAGEVYYGRLDDVWILDSLVDQGLHKRDHVIHDVIHHVNGTAVHVHHDIQAITFILVYHKSFLSDRKIKR
jgi:hypothetical protein